MTEKPGSQYLCLQRDATRNAYKITWWRIAIHHHLFLRYSCVYMYFRLHHVTSKNCKPG